jgi:hypothetical protein
MLPALSVERQILTEHLGGSGVERVRRSPGYLDSSIYSNSPRTYPEIQKGRREAPVTKI